MSRTIFRRSGKVRPWAWLDVLLQDCRFALRTLRKSPAFTATAIVCLGLGIGANTAIFTVIDKVLLQPLPYPDSDRIVVVGRVGIHSSENLQRYAFWSRNDVGLADLTAYQPSVVNLRGGDVPELVNAIQASRNYFRLFGTAPLLGRAFNAAEDRPGGARVAVVSHALWQRRFGGDSGILSKTIHIGDEPYSVIGVLPPAFVPYPQADVWTPLQADPNSSNLASTLTVAGRLPRGTTLAQARSRMSTIASRYEREHPQSIGRSAEVQVAPLREQMSGDIRPLLLLLWGAVGLVLLIACANVANMLLARGASRKKEIAIRAAIGAGRGRIVRQLVTESLLLALGGAAIGLAIGRLGLRAILAFTPGELPRAQEIASSPALDPWVTGFALLAAIFAGLLFGVLPAIQASNTELTSSLKDGGGGGGTKRNRTPRLLVVAEVAIALVLLCGAMLLIRSFAAMHALSLGFEPRGLLTMEISLSGARYGRSSEVDRLARQLVDRLQSIPGVESASIASALPLFGVTDMIFDIPGNPRPDGKRFAGDVQWRYVSPQYFQLLRIPLRSGRLLREQEPGRSVVISQEMARKFWSSSNPVGQAIYLGPGLGPGFEAGATEIVGVVGDVRERFDHATGSSVMYLLPSQIPDRAMALMNQWGGAAVLVRARPGVNPNTLGRPVQDELRAIAGLSATNVRTMEQAGLESTPRHNFSLLLFGLFAAVATLLAAVGVYGVMAYSVEQKRHEIGIRMALGASRGATLTLVVRHALQMAAIGIVAGGAASAAMTRLIQSQLFGVAPLDPMTFITVPLILLAVASAAAYIPAFRASRVDPIIALRAE